MSDLIFHLGMTKTASTFLQEQVFGGKMHTMDRSADMKQDRAVAWQFQQFFTAMPPVIWRTKRGAKQFDIYDAEVKSNVLISHESLYEHIPYQNKELTKNMYFEPYLLAARLHEINEYAWLHGQVKAFIFIRRQADWLTSIYGEVGYRLDRPSQKDFEKRTRDFISHDSTCKQVLSYDILYNELAKSLGEGNVIMIPFELIEEKKTWETIGNFTGFDQLKSAEFMNREKRNVSKRIEGGKLQTQHRSYLGPLRNMLKSDYVAPAWAVVESIAPDVKKRLRKLFPAEKLVIHMPDYLISEVNEVYRDSNERCSNMINYDLMALGY